MSSLVPLVPPSGSPREKILVYGDAKRGKTSSWLSIATLYQQTETPGTFWVIDTDDAMERMLSGRGLKNVDVFPARKWAQYREGAERAVSSAETGDWIVVDFIDRAWEKVRDWYLAEINDETPDQYFLRMKKELKDAGRGGKKNRMSLYDEIDWDVVKPEYAAFIEPLLYDTKAHLFFVCEEKAVWKEGKPTDKTKPGGNTGLPFQVHSVILLDKLKRGYTMNNVMWGDRERPAVENETYTSFAMQYLVAVAGWSIAKEGG